MKYFYYGDDGFAIDAAVRRIINDFSSNNPGLKPMRLDASDGVTNDIIAQMIAVSLFEPSRLVIVRGVLAVRRLGRRFARTLIRCQILQRWSY